MVFHNLLIINILYFSTFKIFHNEKNFSLRKRS